MFLYLLFQGSKIDLTLYKILQDINNGDITDQYLDIITDILCTWDNVLHSGVTYWSPFTSLMPDSFFNLVYEPRPYNVSALRQASSGLVARRRASRMTQE